jgi:hypothetical protein
MAEATSLHRYPFGVLLGEYCRAGIGLLFTLGPLAVTVPLAPVTGVLATLAALFAAYGVRTIIRHSTVIALSDHAMETRGPLGMRLAWDEMRALSVRYFSTRRDRAGGWMQLKVRGRRRAIRVDSTIEGFATILLAAARAARARGVRLDASSLENLRAQGIRLAIGDEAEP